MKNDRKRGNVLMVALFMAIFLFFLSVALVSQNRMDISLGLSVDHRLRAEEAARSGLERALSVMRTRSNWHDLLEGERTLASGASYQVTVREYPEVPHVLKIESTGVSGLIREVQWALVEETGLPGSAKGSGSPYLFRKTADSKLAVAGADFQWHDLGDLPYPESSLAASDGPLFVFDQPGTGTPPPGFLDRLPLFLQNEDGSTMVVQGPTVWTELVPAGNHLLTLKLTDGQAEWVDVPDPGPQLGRAGAGLMTLDDSAEMKGLPTIRLWQEPSVEPDDRPPWDRRNVRLRGRNRQDSGYDIFTVEMENGSWSDNYGGVFDSHIFTIPWGETIDPTSDENTLDWETITEPQIFLEWYSLDGTALSARGRTVTCHATHYFYGHILTQDLGWPEFGTSTYESIVYRRPCILQYDLDTEKWKPLSDYMKVDDPTQPPKLSPCPALAKTDIAVNSQNQTYAFTDEKKKRLLKLHDKSFDMIGKIPTSVYQIVLYKDEPYYFAQQGLWHGNEARLGLTSLKGTRLDPNKEHRTAWEEMKATVVLDGEPQEIKLRNACTVEFGMQAQGLDATVTGDSLICAGWVDRDVEAPKNPEGGEEEEKLLGYQSHLPDRTILTLFHYDGKDWQIWPGGVDDLLRTPVREQERIRFEARDNEGGQLVIRPSHLAMGRYDEGYSPVARYSVLASGKGE